MVQKCSKMVQICSKMVQNVTKQTSYGFYLSKLSNSSKLVQASSGRFRRVQAGSGRFSWVQAGSSGSGSTGQDKVTNKLHTLQRPIYFIQNPLPLPATLFQRPLDNFFFSFTIRNNSSTTFKMNCLLQITLANEMAYSYFTLAIKRKRKIQFCFILTSRFLKKNYISSFCYLLVYQVGWWWFRRKGCKTPGSSTLDTSSIK